MAKVKELRFRRSRKALGVELMIVNFPIFILLVIIFVLIFIFLFGVLSLLAFMGIGAALILFFACLIGAITITTRLWWKSKEYIITQDRIVIVDGVFGSRQRVHNMKGQTSMQLVQTPIKKMFDYGSIQVNFMGGETVTITNIRAPERRILLIEELVDKGEIEVDNLV